MFRIEMTQKEVDEIQAKLDAFSKPVGRCWVCNIPVYAKPEDEKPICLECFTLQNEYRRLSHELDNGRWSQPCGYRPTIDDASNLRTEDSNTASTKPKENPPPAI